MQFPPLQADRLTLRGFELSDIPALLPLIGDRRVAATTLRIPHPYTEADARDFITAAQQDLATGRELHVCLELRENHALCGGAGLRFEPGHHRAELGYWIGVSYWGNGYATEAAGALFKYGFGRLALRRIHAGHVADNIASARVLQKIGMRHEGSFPQHILKWGNFLDLELYGMLASYADRPRDTP